MISNPELDSLVRTVTRYENDKPCHVEVDDGCEHRGYSWSGSYVKLQVSWDSGRTTRENHRRAAQEYLLYTRDPSVARAFDPAVIERPMHFGKHTLFWKRRWMRRWEDGSEATG